MTAPLRRFLLNRQIALEARHIAHGATKTCKFEGPGDDDDEHTKNCNKLKGKVMKLAMQVKLAALQPELTEPEPPPPLFEPEPEPTTATPTEGDAKPVAAKKPKRARDDRQQAMWPPEDKAPEGTTT